MQSTSKFKKVMHLTREQHKKRTVRFILIILILLSFVYRFIRAQHPLSVENIPPYRGMSYVVIDNNQPNFEEKLKKETYSFEHYSELDRLGRCGPALARIGSDRFPKAKRQSITEIRPTGWHDDKYDCIDGEKLYNRCHLIGYQLTGQNQNIKNLITGTEYLNHDGMLIFENMVADYIHETDNHVLYRVTPIFHGNERLARGVQIEAYSVEDHGKGISFNVYAYNIQPSIEIDYKTGKSHLKN